MSGAASEDPKVVDPTIDHDMRMTMREWVIYWKVKYESQLVKVKECVDIFERLKIIIKDQQARIVALEQQKEAMDAQYRAEQEAREAAAKAASTGDATRPKRLRKAEAQG